MISEIKLKDVATYKEEKLAPKKLILYMEIMGLEKLLFLDLLKIQKS